MKISKELLSIIIDGASVVYEMGTTNKTLIFRMPKGKFIQDTRVLQVNNKFEYVVVQNLRSEDELSVVGWRNGTKRSVQKRVYNEELSFSYGDN
tara:strand:+ start:318 stop:599 length:282 start_codon:yes stop_codon:yes gene_type:complete